MTAKSNVKLTRNDYTVGWICALYIELAASGGMLDEVHQDLDGAQGDKNIYTLGRIGKHNVVMACLPSGATGITPAAKVATDMLRSFPRIRFGLMVGIGGGAPSPNKLPSEDIRLGDVVVSIPDGELGGVVKYDRGKVVAGGEFEHTGLLNMPPALLTNAVAKLRGRHEFKRNAVSRYVSEMVKKMLESEDVNPDFEDMYQYQGSKYDQLFEADYEHADSEQISNIFKQSQDTSGKVPDDPKLPCPNCDEARLVARKPRRTNDHVIHYGTIASADRVMRHGTTREKLRKKYGILCFEMEAAGLMNDFPCLVIRGICDYSDTHKHKIWQRYAAATAAAYAKELLEIIQLEEVEMTEDAAKVLEKVHENTTLILAGQQQQDRDKILNWLDLDTHTRRFADSLQKWQRGTGQQFLNSEKFLNWTNKDTQTLWCPGIAGAGKTILTSVVIKHLKDAQKDKEPAGKAGIICLYCEYERQKDQTPHSLLAAVLRQLADQSSPFPKSVEELYKLHDSSKTHHSFDEISSILPETIRKFSQVFLVVDALDECSEKSCRELLSNLQDLQKKTGMKLLATSRHTVDFRRNFEGCAMLEIKANESDVRAVLDSQMGVLSACVTTDNSVLRNKVKEEITAAVDGMFVLAVPFLESLVGKRSSGDVEEALKALVESSDKISTVYNGAIERVDNQNRNDRETAHRVLSWIVHAKRLLTCQELQHALAVRTGSREFQEQYIYHHLEEIVALCAGLVVINQKSNTVQLMHDTTRMYFEDRTHQPDWIRTAEVERAQNCLTYLSLSCFESGYATNRKMFEERLTRYRFLNYAACFWGEHARAVQEVVDLRRTAKEFLQNAELISCAAQARYSVHQIPFYGYSQEFPKQVALHFVAQFGLHEFLSDLLVKSQENEQSDVNVHDSLVRTPLSYAAEKGYEAVVKLLLEKGADVESRDNEYGRTPLWWAILYRHGAVVKLLLEKGADVESEGRNGRTPLSWAAENGHEAVVRLLLEKGADVESRDEWDQTPLSYAAVKGHEVVVKLLLEKGADVESKGTGGRRPLSYAAVKGHEVVVRLLLEKGADVESKGTGGRTPLSYAAEKGHEMIVKLLLEKGADVESKGTEGWTPLLWAAEKGHEVIIRLLLEKGADVESKGTEGWTPLSYAAENGHEAVMRLLLEKGADVESRDTEGWTPLSWAAEKGHEAVMRLLLEKGADVDSRDTEGRTPLLWAAEKGREAVVRLLLGKGANVESRDEWGRTPLLWAAEKGHEAVVRLLLEKGVDVESRYTEDQTPLLWAVVKGHEAVVKLLLEKGADVESRYTGGSTPLLWAAEKGHEAVVKLLLEKGADVESRDRWDQTPLLWATVKGYEAVVKLLLEKGADVESKDTGGRTPLSWAAYYGHEAVVKLLESRA